MIVQPLATEPVLVEIGRQAIDQAGLTSINQTLTYKPECLPGLRLRTDDPVLGLSREGVCDSVRHGLSGDGVIKTQVVMKCRL